MKVKLPLNAFNYCKLPTAFVETGSLLILSSLDKGVFIFRKNDMQDQSYTGIK